MAINLLQIKPHKVSTDLTGYITYIYGAPKTGKTTLATQMPGAILLAFEKGYNALPGVMAQDITSWGEMKQVYRELKKPAVKQMYQSIIVDTIDIAADMCQKYICDQNGITTLGELGFGKGWTFFKNEFSQVFRGLTQLGYAVLFIGHDREVMDDAGNKTIRPALSNSTRIVIAGMADIIGYAHQVKGRDSDKTSTLTVRCADDSIECGARFKYMKSEFPMSYDNLVEELRAAIEKEAAEHDNKFITDEKQKTVEREEYDFDTLMKEFKGLCEALMDEDESNASKITATVEHYLGKGKKASEITPYQVEFLHLINEDLRNL